MTGISNEVLNQFIEASLKEDVKDGDHSTLSCIDKNAIGKSKLLFKSSGIAAGIELAQYILKYLDAEITIDSKINDGERFQYGDVGFTAQGNIHALLMGERLLLNCMQRMTAIATETHKYVEKVKHTNCKILDTRKTTPNLRFLEKWAVRLGGGTNHRFGLYDMIMLKDNHVDFCGGITKALSKAQDYLQSINRKDIPIEIETRNLEEVQEALSTGIPNRIMLDNFSPELIIEALKLINGSAETEASGGINLNTVSAYAETGVDFVSVGALTHGVKSMDISFKTVG